MFALNLNAQNPVFEKFALDTSMNVSEMQFLKPYLKDKKVVLTGENHMFTHSNQMIKLRLMLSLYKHGFRYFMMELGHGAGYLANDYVTTGNQKALDILYKGEIENNPIGAFLETIRRFNDGKSYEDQIKIRGVDYTRYPLYSTRALALIIEEKDAVTKLPIYFEDLQVISSAREDVDKLGFSSWGNRLEEDFDIKASFKTYRSRLFELSMRNLITDFYRDTLQFKEVLGDKYDDFKEILDEIDVTLKWYKGEGLSVQMHVQRERHLEQRVKDIFKKDPNTKVLGQFGRCHIRNEQYSQDCFAFDMASMAERIEKNEDFKKSVLTIPILYEEFNDFHIPRSTRKKFEDILQIGKIVGYIADSSYVNIKYDPVSGPVILNSISRFAYLEDILKGSNQQVFNNLKNRYRDNFVENHIEIINQQLETSSLVNDDFGVNIFPSIHRYFGIGFRNVNEFGWQSTFRFQGIAPVFIDEEDRNLRYSNWRFDFGYGYNFIHRKYFSLYSDIFVQLGFGKIREQLLTSNEAATFEYFEKPLNYRNTSLGVLADVGMRIKLNFFTLFFEAGYQYDTSNPKWTLNGASIETSPNTTFTGLVLTGGISFYVSERY